MANHSRRRFLRNMLWSMLAALLGPGLNPALGSPADDKEDGRYIKAMQEAGKLQPWDVMPHRTFGKTWELIALLGLSGTSLAGMRDEERASALLRSALAVKGKKVIDLVWEEEGAAPWVAKALEKGDREKVYLVTGTDGKDKQACLGQLHRSLERLKVRHIDQWMIKESIHEADPLQVFSKDGAIGAAEAAVSKGLAKFIGIAGWHSTEFFMAAMHGYFDFRAAEFPMDGIGGRYMAFHEHILPRLRVRNIATIVSNPLVAGPQGGYPMTPKELLWLLWSDLINVAAVDADSAQAFGTYARIARTYSTVPKVLTKLMLMDLPGMRPPQEILPSTGKGEKAQRNFTAPPQKYSPLPLRTAPALKGTGR